MNIISFMKKSIKQKGESISVTPDNNPYDASKAIEAMKEMQKISEEKGNTEMTLEEINEEIRLARAERKKHK